jgi:hypothetical protein
MTKGRLDKKQRCADQRHKRALAAGGLGQGARKKPVPAAPRPPVRLATGEPGPLVPHHYPKLARSLGRRQTPGGG